MGDATLENVSNVRPLGEDFRWFLKLKCGNCGEIPDKWQYVTLVENVPLKGGRGSASMVQKCKLCARENSIGGHECHFMFQLPAADNETFKTMVQFECRGLEPVDFQPQDWTDYDEKAKESVGIYEVTHRFIKC
uniref:CXXC motif containing zinc binding protein n=1 Tax=Fundulus heteroclitus TaxID=8078 RepID=A0A3Q2PM93_FUNHE